MKEQSEKKSQSPKPKDAPAVKMDNVKESKEENIGKGNSMSLCPATVSESGDGFACRYCPDVKESIEELERHEINVHGALKPKVVLPKKEEISRINDEFDKTLPDVQALAERFEFADEIKKARPLIKDMFKKRSFAVPDETQTKRNKNKLKHWIVDEYCNEYFQKEIGFTKDTYDSQLWPAKKVADILLKKLEIHFPGVMKDRKFCHALVRKFEDERQKHKDILKIEGPRKGAQAELEKQARIETEAEEARLEAEAAEKARPEPEAEAEEKARLKAEAAEKARLEAEAAEKAGLEAEAEAQAKAESEEKARLEAEAAEKARPEAEAERAKAKGEAEEHAGIEAEAQEQTRLEAAKPEKLIEPTVEKPAQVIEASEEAAKPEETQNDDTKEVKAVIGAAGAASIGATAAAVTANTKTKKPANPKTKKSAPGTKPKRSRPKPVSSNASSSTTPSTTGARPDVGAAKKPAAPSTTSSRPSSVTTSRATPTTRPASVRSDSIDVLGKVKMFEMFDWLNKNEDVFQTPSKRAKPVTREKARQGAIKMRMNYVRRTTICC